MQRDSADPLDRLDRAMEAYLAYCEQSPGGDEAEFLAEHEDLRDLLGPLLAQRRSAAPPVPGGESARYLGGYRIECELGRGGMGVVYEAVEVALGRRVALKVLPAHLTLASAQIERFRREAASAASLRHPGIVPIYGVGEVEGTHFFAMELVEGETLAELCQRRRGEDGPLGVLPDGSRAGEAAEITAQVAEALDFAHRNGVVHRDVKPQNILIDGDGRVRVVDFGLAKDVTRESLTMSGRFAGTPHYMSPEHAAGRPVDARSDVFALGVVLYELLTDHRPFEGDTDAAVLLAVATHEPRPLRGGSARVPRDLEIICFKALEKDPAHRYQTCAAMAADLRRFLRLEPIEAQPPGTVSRVWKAVRRRKTLAAVTGAVSVLCIAGAIAWTVHDAGRDAREVAGLRTAADLLDALAEGPLMAIPRREREIRDQIESALASADELLERAPEDLSPELVKSAARLMLITGKFYIHLRDRQRAHDLLTRAIQLQHDVVRRNSNDFAARIRLAGTYHDRAIASDEPADRDRDFQTAIDLFGAVAASEPPANAAAQARAGLALTLSNRAHGLLLGPGGVAAALAVAREAEALWGSDAEHGDGSHQLPEVEHARLRTILTTADLLVAAGRPAEATSRYAAVRRAIEARSAEPGAQVTFGRRGGRLRRSALFLARAGEAHAAYAAGRLDDARAAFEDAIESGESLAKDFPLTPRYTEQLASARYALGSVLAARRDFEAAERVLESTTSESAGLRTRATRVLEMRVRSLLTIVRWQLGNTDAGRLAEDFALVDRQLEQFDTEHPEMSAAASARGAHLHRWAGFTAASGDLDPAITMQREALALQRRAYADDPTFVGYSRFVLMHCEQLIVFLLRAGQPELIPAVSRELVEIMPAKPRALADAAWFHCKAIIGLHRAEAADLTTRTEKLAAEAIQWLTTAVDRGLVLERYPRRRDLRPLFGRPEFDTLRRRNR